MKGCKGATNPSSEGHEPMTPEEKQKLEKRWGMTLEEKEKEWGKTYEEKLKEWEDFDRQVLREIRTRETPHDRYVRKQMDKGNKERAIHRFVLTRQPNSQKCSTDGCHNRKLPYSDKCNSCESD